jgi:hypothetical protein
MSIALKVFKESPFKSVDGIAAHEGKVAVGKTGAGGHGIPWATALIQIDAHSFVELAQAMMDASSADAIRAFGQAMVKGSQPPKNSN